MSKRNNFIEENTQSILTERKMTKSEAGDQVQQKNEPSNFHYDNLSEYEQESMLLANQAYQNASKVSYPLYNYDKFWHSNVKMAKREHKIVLIKKFIQEFPQLSLQNANFTPAKLINDTINDKNHQVVLETLKMISIMAKRLGKQFHATAKNHFKDIISKFRETNPQTIKQTTKATFECLTDLFNCLSIQEVLDKIKQGMNDGSPNMRKNMVSWLKSHLQVKMQHIQYLQQKGEDFEKKKLKLDQLIKEIDEQVQKLKKDANKDVRNAASECQNIYKKDLANHSEMLNPEKKTYSYDKKRGFPQNQSQKKKGNISQKNHPLFTKEFQKQQEKFDDLKTNEETRDLSYNIKTLLPNLNNNADFYRRKSAAQYLSTLLQQGEKINFGDTIPELLAVLKIRINEPNKQLSKVFLHLLGQVLCKIPQRQFEQNARNYISILVQKFNDQSQIVCKQIHQVLEKIAEKKGKKIILSMIGNSLQGDKIGRLKVLNLMLSLQEGIPKTDLKCIVKGLINCLCDKNEEIINRSEELFQKVYQRIGLQPFCLAAKDQKPANQKLRLFLNKYNLEKKTNNSQANLQKLFKNAKHPPINKNLSSKSFPKKPLKNEISQQINTAKKQNIKYAQVQKDTNQQEYSWVFQQIHQEIQTKIKKQIQHKMPSLSEKMLSFNYKRVIQVAEQIKDSLKKNSSFVVENYDILLRWILLRLWGGQPRMSSIIQLVVIIIQALDRNEYLLKQTQVSLIFAIIRQYLLSLIGNLKHSKNFYLIFPFLFRISPRESVLKNVKSQQSLAKLYSIHSQLKGNSQFNEFYTETMEKIPNFKPKDYVKLDKDKIEDSSGFMNINLSHSFGKLVKEEEENRQNQKIKILNNNKIISTMSQSFDLLQNNDHRQNIDPSDENHLSQYKAYQFRFKIQNLMSSILAPNDFSHSAFNALFQETSQDVTNELAANAKFIFASILKSVEQILSERRRYTPNRIVAQLNLLINCIKCPHIIINIGELVEPALNFALAQLIYQDQHKKQIEEELCSRNIQQSNTILRAVNSVILRILQKINPQQIINILIELLTKYSSENSSSKIVSLTIKCLSRSSHNCCKSMESQERVITFFIKSHKYLTSIHYDTPLQFLNLSERKGHSGKKRPQDIASNLIKQIIADFCRSINQKIWEIYYKALIMFGSPDNYIAPYMQSLINQKNWIAINKINRVLPNIQRLYSPG